MATVSVNDTGHLESVESDNESLNYAYLFQNGCFLAALCRLGPTNKPLPAQSSQKAAILKEICINQALMVQFDQFKVPRVAQGHHGHLSGYLVHPLIPLFDRVMDLFASIRCRSFKGAGGGQPVFTFCFRAGDATGCFRART